MERAVVLMVIIAGFALTSRAVPDGFVLVANKGEHTLGIIDAASGRQIASVPETGVTGHEVAASRGSLAFVPIYGNSGVGQPGTDGRTMDVIDLKLRRVVHTVDFGRGVRPHCAVFGPKDGLLYVTTELDDSVTIVDPGNFKILGKIPTGQRESHMLAISPDGRYGYTANVGPGTVSVLDMAARKTLKVIPVADHVQRISISPDGRWVFTSDTEKARLAVIDAASNQLKHWIELRGEGYGTASTPDGRWLLVAMPHANQVALVDLASFEVVKNIDVPSAPQEVLIAPNGQIAYVSCDHSRQVAAIHTKEWSVKLINAGEGADGLAWAMAP
jgi:YVTN family beta-propeller protein